MSKRIDEESSGGPGREAEIFERSSTVASITVESMLVYALSVGMTAEDIESVAGRPLQEFGNCTGRVPDDTVHKIMRALAMRYPDRALSIEMSSMVPLTIFGSSAETALYADDVRGALGLLADNSELCSDRLSVDYREFGSTARLSVWHPLDRVDNGRISEVGFGVVWRLLRYMLGDTAKLAGVRLGFSGNGPIARYRAFFGAPIEYTGDPRDHALLFDRDVISRKNPRANPSLFRLGSKHLEELLAEHRRDGASEQIAELRAAIVESARSGEFTPRAVAARAHRSLRSAQRLATQQGVTLRGLIDQARAETAKDLLANDPTIGLVALCSELGYTDERALRRAFKRWTGMSMAEYRRLLRGSVGER